MDARDALIVGAVALALSLPGCSLEAQGPARYGEALVVVDTDLPVPQIAGRLRVDLFAEDGTWFESRDAARPSALDWPASFSVYTKKEASDERVIIRLRTYPEGLVRDYRGERFFERGAPVPKLDPTSDRPRLVRRGIDVTPSVEPKPMVTVDRLVLVRLRPGLAGRARVTLRGACLGTMPLLGAEAPYQTIVVGEAETCIDVEGERVPLAETPLDQDMTIPPANSLGTFGIGEACDPEAASDPRAECVPGGIFVLGSSSATTLGPPLDPVPERVAAVSRFWLDRHEVTVGSLRAAIARGDIPSGPILWEAHDAPAGQPAPGDVDEFSVWCTGSNAPIGREDYPATCVGWRVARQYCRSLGGDLPTEAQWEYAASSAGRPFKTVYPWGNDSPDCARAVFARGDPALERASGCSPPMPRGPRPVTATPGDVTPLGIFGMGGNAGEMVLDTIAAYDDPCWTGSPVLDPFCSKSNGAAHSQRGGAFDKGAVDVSTRVSVPENDPVGPGFRCAFAQPPGKNP